MDELLAADEHCPDEPAVGQLDEFSGDVAPYAEYRRLVAEQAALRRLATLVARGVEPWEVFDAVTKEMCRCVPAEAAGLWRYETSGEITMVAAAYHPAAAPVQWPVGTRTPTAGNTLASMVLAQRRARSDGQLRERRRGPRDTGACGGHPRCGGCPGHRRWTRVGPGGGRFGTTGPDAGRHRGPHQPLRRTCRECRGGGIPR